jgi:hypothetical protein
MRVLEETMQDRGRVSAFRDSLPDDATRARYDVAIEAFAEVLAAGCDARDALYVEGGAAAVAEAAWVPGGPSKAEIAATYEELRSEALAQQRGDVTGRPGCAPGSS